MPEASASRPGAPEPSPLLAERLAALRLRHVTVAAGTGLAMSLIVCLELLALAMFLDWWIELRWAIRLVSLIGQIGLGGFLVFRLVLRPVFLQPDEDELALMVEKARPEFRTRLIASIQLARPGALPASGSVALVGALVQETESLARSGDFGQIVPTDRLKKFGVMAVVIPMIAVTGYVAGRETCGVLLRRVLLSNEPVPRKTRIDVPNGNRVVGIGDTIRLEAFVRGVSPGNGVVRVQHRSRRSQEIPLEQNRDDAAHFGRTIENIQESFTYQFLLGDGVSEEFEVKAIPRPTVSTLECEQDYPAYTGLKTARRAPGDLTLLAGSTLRLKATATKDLQAAALALIGMGSEIPLTLSPTNARELSGRFVVPGRGLTGFQIQMLDTDGMESRDSAIFRVDILPDKPPQVRLTYPDRKEELVTRGATMLVAFEASDDFLVSKIRLKFKSDAVDNGAERFIELEPGPDAPQRLRRRYEWKIAESLPGLTEGSRIEYWIEAEDNNNVTGPGVGATEHQLARVVSEAEKRAELLNRAGDYLGSISDVALDQEKLNKSLGLIIKEKAGLR